MSSLHRAKVVRVAISGVFIEIPSLNPGYEYGPCTLSAPFELDPGRPVLVGYIDDIPDDPVIIGPLLSSYAADPAVGIRSFPDRTARDVELPAPAVPTFAWIDDDQVLEVYTVEPPTGWHILTSGVDGVFPGGIVVDGPAAFQQTLTVRQNLFVTDDLVLPNTSGQVRVGGSPSAATFAAQRANPGDPLLTSRVASEANNRFQIATSGHLTWGDGTAAVDTMLYRGGADQLRTDDSLHIQGDLSLGGRANFSIDKLSDVDLTGQANGQFLRRASGAWVPSQADLDDLSDVALGTVDDGDVLVSQSLAWSSLAAHAIWPRECGFAGRPGSGGATSVFTTMPGDLSCTLTKRYGPADTDLRVDFHTTFFLINAQAGTEFGVAISGVRGAGDFVVASYEDNTPGLSIRLHCTGVAFISGVGAGTVTATAIWRRTSGTGTPVVHGPDDWVSFAMREVPASNI